MLLNVYVAMFGKEYGAMMEVERRVVPHVCFESIFILSPLSAGTTDETKSVFLVC